MLSPAAKFIRAISRRAFRKVFFSFPPPAGFTTAQEWIEQQADRDENRLQTVVEETVLQRTMPRTIESELHRSFEMWRGGRDPAINVSVLKDGRAFGKNGSVITSDNFLVTDLCDQLGRSQGAHSLSLYSALPRLRQVDGTVGVMSAFAASTYYHFLFDTIPRIHFLQQYPIDYYFVNDRSGFQKQLLQLVGVPSNKIISATRHAHVQARRLVATSVLSRTGTVSKSVWQFLRGLLDQRDTSLSFPRKIYISRGDVRYRRVKNEEQVIATLAKYGYQSLKLSGLSVKQQIQLFSQVSHVVSPHGAGLSNLTFAAPHTKVLELFSPRYINPCYWTLGQHGKLDYCYLIGTGPPPKKVEPPSMHRQHITVDIEKLVASVELMES